MKLKHAIVYSAAILAMTIAVAYGIARLLFSYSDPQARGYAFVASVITLAICVFTYQWRKPLEGQKK